MLGEIFKYVLLGTIGITCVFTARKLDRLHRRSAVVADMVCHIRDQVQTMTNRAEQDADLTDAVKLEDEAKNAARIIDAYKKFNLTERRHKE